ncbi:TLP18.3, Psb32 and MOLO-1 founding protein of phosphatase [Actinokineospora alba]|uniref:TLP18.3, Psb32 and MOLO-1 founding protein of phosphatase n=1 Tax=Actinokineospora alba TaxID=504798 RepID=A0A1H0U198_9PSEU|nr:TPM domain-containing protein [Actinokineospora alba]TDP70826.1 TLP18.3/Psb32/MOLO-1 phosphatase superfamily protein [Actinokineospora alba]SDJ17479.1 TLP18.3, Psb32 and MOLO-1 founding protein of phosphatase [Actinokineospora alba]SDP59616.1 TLP18.3, Psb32 and MOLO-1 founding protein of phosphatase [Actinokineospora alba]
MPFARVLTVVAFLVLICLPGVASADPPSRLANQITDTAQALDAGERSEVQAAIDKLYESRKLRLWVVFVPDFDGQAAASWAQRTATLSALGDRDVVLAVATVDREYNLFSAGLPQEISDAEFENLLVDGIEPALRTQNWAGAAVAAASGLDTAAGASASGRGLLIGGAAIAAGLGGVYVYTRVRKRSRVKASIEAARDVDPLDTAALGALPVEALDQRSKDLLVELDNALRTSAEELELARGEFGADQTRPFAEAFDTAKAALAQAFTLRQRLDDKIPETPQQRRDLLVDIISGCGAADRELDAQVAEFDGMRDLLINAPQRLDALTQEMVTLSSRLPESTATLERLVGEFPAPTLAPVRDNVTHAKERLDFADRNITEGRSFVARPAGQQGPAVAAIRAAEGAVGQARTLLDAVDSAADNIRHAIATLPAALEEARADLAAAGDLAAHGGEDLASARAAAADALTRAEAAQGSNPLGSFTEIAAADVELDKAIAAAATEKQRVERLREQLDQAMTAASAQVTAAGDFISTRRGAVEAEARTRLSEAQRHLDEAGRLRESDPSTALQHAQTAADLGARAARAAEADVREWERRNAPQSPFGGTSGAILGGIMLNSVLRGGGGGGGGYSPGSFGGSSSSRRIGGGGRF